MNKVTKWLTTAEKIYIYGAGILGRKVFNVLSSYDFGFKLMGYVVSDTSTYCDVCNMPPVLGIDQVENDALIIIAMNPQYHKEVQKNLEIRGIDRYIIWNDNIINELWKNCPYQFTNRKKGFSKVCFVLAGYKEFLWKDVFERLCCFLPSDVEVCILSSGVDNKCLEEIAEKNDWSYLYTYRNNITLVQNIALSLYEEAVWIYKMDEDIFLTEKCFEKMMTTYNMIDSYDVGCIVPLIPVNSYGYRVILERTGYLGQYEMNFEKAVYGATPRRMIENDYHTAEFMWGYKSPLPRIDELNRIFQKEDKRYSVCGVRFSIGFILFKKEFWENMGGFPVTGNIDLGLDEVAICQQCITESKALIVAENTVVGHFSFGRQTKKIRELYEMHHELFALRD